jgi:hypothetical protein
MTTRKKKTRRKTWKQYNAERKMVALPNELYEQLAKDAKTHCISTGMRIRQLLQLHINERNKQ